jgi:hypothetical protein
MSIGQYAGTEYEPSAAPSAFSLSMMRQAFDGLLVYTETSLSSNTEQRDELEPPVDLRDGPDGQSRSFVEERYSYNAVNESASLRIDDMPARGPVATALKSPSSFGGLGTSGSHD